MREIAIGTKVTPGESPAESLRRSVAFALTDTSRGEVRVQTGEPVGAYQFVHCQGAALSSKGEALGGDSFERVVAAVADWTLSAATADEAQRFTNRLVRAGRLDMADADAFARAARARLDAHPESNLPPLPHLRGLLQHRIAAALHIAPRLVVDGVVRFRCPEIRRAVEGAVNQTLDAHRRRKPSAGGRARRWQLEDALGRSVGRERAGELAKGTRPPGSNRASLAEDAELLALLRGFVQMHEVQSGEVHVHPRSGGPATRFVIVNDEGEVVETEYLEGIASDWIESEVEYEDLLMSALISLGPSHIHLHLPRDSEVVTDVCRVFDGSATVCPGCEKCDARREGESERTPDRRGRVST